MNAFKFDGWLLNFENEIEAKLMPKLISLIDSIRSECKKLNENSKLIWYDSVIYPEGKLIWQNELNDKNEIFFDYCDGFYLNYTWKFENLVQSCNLSNSKGLKDDLYVGIDVFGKFDLKIIRFRIKVLMNF